MLNLLGHVDVALLTSNSLFADAATKRAGGAVLRRYFINSSECCKEWGPYCKMMCKSPMEMERGPKLDCDAVLYEKTTHAGAHFSHQRPTTRWAHLPQFSPFSEEPSREEL